MMDINKIASEQEFHDQWALSESINKIDVIKFNTAVTSPELRYIHHKLGDVKNKKILDVGCGLGEVSVFFAKNGAEVVATDLSQEMLNFTNKLAEKNNVKLKTHLSNAEDFNFRDNEEFDIIYVGNLFHHVDIDLTIYKIKRHLKKDGILVSWDPLAYNPLINIYRMIATDVRTPDEHPLKKADLDTFKKNFRNVEFKFFWLFTLIIFILMFVIQFRSPNKERYWKKVVDEADRWEKIYSPLKFVDDCVLKYFPFFNLLTWNVVIFAKNKI